MNIVHVEPKREVDVRSQRETSNSSMLRAFEQMAFQQKENEGHGSD
jgi:hypothetical protein